MKVRKLVSAGLKLGGAATTGLFAASYMMQVIMHRRLPNELHVLGIGCIGSSFLLAKESVQDVVGAFKSDEE